MGNRDFPVDASVCPLGPSLQPYWDRRHSLFSKFDEGVQIDAEGLYSVKPEAIALEIGQRMPGDIVLDAFCGVGGSAIGFARAGKKVIAVETNGQRLGYAKANAVLYGVADQITFIQGDAVKVMANCQCDAVYLDPPWGGPEYTKLEWFPLAGFCPNGRLLLDMALRKTPHVAFTFPVNFDLRELRVLTRDFELKWSEYQGRIIFSTAFF